MQTSRTAILTFCLTFPASANATEPVYKDLRKPGSNSSYAVAFVARAGAPGHAFVIFCSDDEKKQACVVEAFGFYPTVGAKAVLGSVPGKIVDEYREKTGAWKAGTHLVVLVEKDAYDKAEAVRKKWATGKDYKLVEADCVTFQSEVAKSLGLNLPARNEAKLPATFTQKLRDLNK